MWHDSGCRFQGAWHFSIFRQKSRQGVWRSRFSSEAWQKKEVPVRSGEVSATDETQGNQVKLLSLLVKPLNMKLQNVKLPI